MRPEQLLTSEDSLRLNVLVTQAEALRIDSRGPAVIGLAGDRELRVALHPEGREDAYLLAVRRLLASLVIGHPGGFPVFIRRWLRGGQLENLRAADLLKLAEPEAVLAAASSPALDATLARRAWWAWPHASVARALIDNRALPAGELRSELATWLADHLPFEQDAVTVIETLQLIAAPGLLGDAQRERLWRHGATRPAYRVGFLAAAGSDLPEARAAHPGHARVAAVLARYGNDPLVALLAHALDGPGQAYLAACDGVLGDPSDREVISRLLNQLGDWCAAARGTAEPTADVAEWRATASEGMASAPAARLLAEVPELRPELLALHLLAGAHEALCYPVFARSTATGTLLRDKLAAVLQPFRESIAVLLGEPSPKTRVTRRARRLSRSG